MGVGIGWFIDVLYSQILPQTRNAPTKFDALLACSRDTPHPSVVKSQWDPFPFRYFIIETLKLITRMKYHQIASMRFATCFWSEACPMHVRCK